MLAQLCLTSLEIPELQRSPNVNNIVLLRVFVFSLVTHLPSFSIHFRLQCQHTCMEKNLSPRVNW